MNLSEFEEQYGCAICVSSLVDGVRPALRGL